MRIDEEDRARIKKIEDEKKFWEEHDSIPFTDKEIKDKLHRIVPTRFELASKNQIDAKVLELCQYFFNGEGLYLWGKSGIGKTHLCAVLIREHYIKSPKFRKWYTIGENHHGHAEYNPPCDPVMITVPDLFADIKASFGKKDGYEEPYGGGVSYSEKSESQLIEYYSKVGILFLDDIGTEKTTDWAQQTLYTIIDHRYREMLQTVLTSNLSLNELSDKTGDRITSRITEMCKVIELKGKDRRLGI